MDQYAKEWRLIRKDQMIRHPKNIIQCVNGSIQIKNRGLNQLKII